MSLPIKKDMNMSISDTEIETIADLVKDKGIFTTVFEN